MAKRNDDVVGPDLITPFQLGPQATPPFLQHGGRAEQQAPNLSAGNLAPYGGVIGQEHGARSQVDERAVGYLATNRRLNTGSMAMGGYSPHTTDKNRAPFSEPGTHISAVPIPTPDASAKAKPRKLRA